MFREWTRLLPAVAVSSFLTHEKRRTERSNGSRPRVSWSWLLDWDEGQDWDEWQDLAGGHFVERPPQPFFPFQDLSLCQNVAVFVVSFLESVSCCEVLYNFLCRALRVLVHFLSWLLLWLLLSSFEKRCKTKFLSCLLLVTNFKRGKDMNKIKKVSAAAPSADFPSCLFFCYWGSCKEIFTLFEFQSTDREFLSVSSDDWGEEQEGSFRRTGWGRYRGRRDKDRKRRTDHLRKDDNDRGGCFMSFVFIRLCLLFQFPDEKELSSRNKLYIRYRRTFSFCLLTDCLLGASVKKSTRVTKRKQFNIIISPNA